MRTASRALRLGVMVLLVAGCARGDPMARLLAGDGRTRADARILTIPLAGRQTQLVTYPVGVRGSRALVLQCGRWSCRKLFDGLSDTGAAIMFERGVPVVTVERSMHVPDAETAAVITVRYRWDGRAFVRDELSTALR